MLALPIKTSLPKAVLRRRYGASIGTNRLLHVSTRGKIAGLGCVPRKCLSTCAKNLQLQFHYIPQYFGWTRFRDAALHALRHTFLTEGSTPTRLRCSTLPDTITLRPRCATYAQGRMPSRSCMCDWHTC